MMDRLADDLGDGSLAPVPGRVPVLISYAGGGGLGWVRPDVLPPDVQTTGRFALEFEGDGAKCSCSSGTSGCTGPNSGPGGTQTCEAGACTSCKISG